MFWRHMKRDKRRHKKHRCGFCGAYGVTQIHHIFPGPLRRISEREDLVIELCVSCHRKVHEDADFSYCLKHDAQLEWLRRGHTMEEWMRMMHRSWVYIREVPERRERPAPPESGPERFDDEEEEWDRKSRS